MQSRPERLQRDAETELWLPLKAIVNAIVGSEEEGPTTTGPMLVTQEFPVYLATAVFLGGACLMCCVLCILFAIIICITKTKPAPLPEPAVEKTRKSLEPVDEKKEPSKELVVESRMDASEPRAETKKSIMEPGFDKKKDTDPVVDKTKTVPADPSAEHKKDTTEVKLETTNYGGVPVGTSPRRNGSAAAPTVYG